MAWRLQVFIFRLIDFVAHIPWRVYRLLRWLMWLSPIHGSHKFYRWSIGLIFLLIDITPIPVFLESIMDFLKTKTRPLSAKEKDIVQSLFGKSLPIQLLGIDPGSIPAKKKRTVAYVTYHTINYDKTIPDTTFVHELVHIWQYRKFGSIYISEAIWAQRWGGGYNYGGLDALKLNCDGPGLLGFNYEQQADIVEEYYRLKNRLSQQWVTHTPEVEELLNKYCKQVWT